jgi:hypothetical protein
MTGQELHHRSGLHLVRQAPKGHGIRRVEDFGAPMGRDGEHGPRLREMVCSRKTALKDLGAVRAKLSLGVPPALRIHLAASGNGDPHPQQPIQVDLCFHPARFLCSPLGEVAKLVPCTVTRSALW